MKNISRIIRISKPLHKIFFLIMFLSLTGAVVAQFNPLVTKKIIDEIQKEIQSGNGNQNTVITLTILSFAVLMLNTLISSLIQRTGDHLGGELRRFLMRTFYDHIFRLPQSYFDTELSGKIVNQLNRGISSVEQFMKTASNFIFPSFLLAFFTIGLMFVYSPPVALFTIILFPIYTSLSMYSAKKWGKYDVQKNKHEDNSRGRIQEVISNMRLVKGFSNQRNELNYVDNEQLQVNKIYAKQSRNFHIFDFLRNTSLNLVLLGMSLVIFKGAFDGRYTFGTVVLLIQLIAQIRNPLFAMSFILSQIQSTEAGTKEYFEILDLKPEEDFNLVGTKKPIINKIKFENVEFKYDTSENILSDINFEIHKGEKIALVGHSGAGKSTIINLITKFYNTTKGSIYLDNDNYSALSHNDVRANISLVFQENELFSTTIRENVSYGKDSSEEAIWNALKQANAFDFVKKLKDGIDTQIGERGMRLSGGQKQRIQIARALLHDAPIVILDEATSNLDSKSESEVQQALEKLMQGRIVIIIAHRLSTIQNVNKILVISNGKVEASGTPEELSKQDGIYRDLLKYQIDGDKKLLKNFELIG